MLRVRVDVNGNPIAMLAIHNTGRVDSEGRYLYDAGLYRNDSLSGALGIEGVPHHRELGWEPLVADVLVRAMLAEESR